MPGREREMPFNRAGLIVVLAAIVAGCSSHRGRQEGKEHSMNAQVLEQKIVAKDEGALELARQLGGGAEPVLEKLSRHPDAEVRELNVMAMSEAAGPARNKMLINALGDGDINVRSAAVRGLWKSADAAALQSLQMQVGSNPDPYVRGEVSLIIGRIDRKGNTGFLLSRRAVERDGDANHKVVLALTKLGDDAARQTQKAALASPDPQARLKAVREYEYIDDPKTLIDLKPALADVSEVYNINPPHAQPKLIRLCDVAVNVVAKVSKVKLSFDGNERKRFEAPQIAEVVRVVEALK
jgi:HEAT repeat protein